MQTSPTPPNYLPLNIHSLHDHRQLGGTRIGRHWRRVCPLYRTLPRSRRSSRSCGKRRICDQQLTKNPRPSRAKSVTHTRKIHDLTLAQFASKESRSAAACNPTRKISPPRYTARGFFIFLLTLTSPKAHNSHESPLRSIPTEGAGNANP
jgi:hypothetical protein